MEEIMTYVKPELLVLVPVLYTLGAGLKHSARLPSELIPALLGGAGVVLSALWLLGTAGPGATVQDWAMLAFTALVQGLLVSGAAVYANQLLKQSKKL